MRGQPFALASDVIAKFLEDALSDAQLDPSTILAVKELYQKGKLSPGNLTASLDKARK